MLYHHSGRPAWCSSCSRASTGALPWALHAVGNSTCGRWPRAVFLVPHMVYWILEPRGRDGVTGSGLGSSAVEAFLNWSCIAGVHGFLFWCKAARIFRFRGLMPRWAVLFNPRVSLPVSLRSSLSAVLWFPDACAVDSLSAVFSIHSGPSLVSSLGSTLTFWSDGAELSAEQALAGGTSAVLPTS